MGLVRFSAVVFSFALLIVTNRSDGALPIPWQNTASQLVAVVTEEWESPTGVMLVLERGAQGWTVRQKHVAVTVGRKGLGLGVGLHPDGLRGPQKREGDKRAPAGVFRLEFGFGTGPLPLEAFPYRQTTVEDFWVDDPKSGAYNQWVNTGVPGKKGDWKSVEVLRRADGIYDHVIVVGHNRVPVVPGRGSAIFMHSWYGPGIPTIGCTAMEKETVKSLLRWLDSSKGPVLVQAPRELLPRLDLPGEVMRLLESR